jgi:hypothetical protein
VDDELAAQMMHSLSSTRGDGQPLGRRRVGVATDDASGRSSFTSADLGGAGRAVAGRCVAVRTGVFG